MTRSSFMSICLLFLVIIFPPLAVGLDDGCTLNFCINLLLTLCGYIPGVIHALWLCFLREPPVKQIVIRQPMFCDVYERHIIREV